jgi:hypothetical protein
MLGFSIDPFWLVPSFRRLLWQDTVGRIGVRDRAWRSLQGDARVGKDSVRFETAQTPRLRAELWRRSYRSIVGGMDCNRFQERIASSGMKPRGSIDGFLRIVQSSTDEVERAKDILAGTKHNCYTVHSESVQTASIVHNPG